MSKGAMGGAAASGMLECDSSFTVLQSDPGVEMKDIIGLEEAKAALHETIVLPSMRPDVRRECLGLHALSSVHL